MKFLIIYDSFNGCVEECVKILSRLLDGDITIKTGAELKKLNISEFDKVIIGSPIRYGVISKPIKKFCQKNQEGILGKKVGIFVCCIDTANLETYFRKSFSPELVNNTVECVCFGGRVPSNYHLSRDKAALKSIIKEFERRKQKLPNISKKMIELFATVMNEA